MSETSQKRSGPPRFVHHPLVLPTVAVLGGWGLLLGGYFPSRTQPPPSSAVPLDASTDRADASTLPEALAAALPAVWALLEDRPASDSAPIRLTIEFSSGPAEPAVLTVSESAPPSLPALTPSWEGKPEHQSARFDPQILQARTAQIEEAVVPPPIPGPPPAFDPTFLSPLIPESIPVSPMFERDEATSVEALIARPMEDLPDAFHPGRLLDRYRSDEPWVSDPSPTGSGAESVPGTGSHASADRGDQVPEPPAVPETLSAFSSAPEILPEATSENDRLPPPSQPSPSALTPQPASSHGGGPVVPIQFPPPADRRGLRGLFRAYLPPPPIPLVPPPPPRAQGASVDRDAP